MRRLASHFLVLSVFLMCTSLSQMRKAPAGTHAVPGLRNAYLDKTEVTNKAWRDYLRRLEDEYGSESGEFSSAFPDTAVWQQAYNSSFWGSDRYDEHPVVGVTYRQAINYCQWRSEYVSARENRKITYSLPGLKVFKLTKANIDHNKIAEGLYSTNLGFRSFLGICDNAAEMTAKEGVAIAGSASENCLETIEYTVPLRYLGFRCMARL